MVKRMLALNDRGELRYCTVPPELRGIGRCNHVQHQHDGESVVEFMARIEEMVHVDDGKEKEEIVNQTPMVNKLVGKYKKSFNENPDWENTIKHKIKNYFAIGKGDTYEEAEITAVSQERKLDEKGDPVIALNAKFEFRGKEYDVDLGEVPEVQEDSTIIINGSKMRVLPILAQHKSGLVRYNDKAIIKKEDGHIGMVYNIGEETASIRGKEVSIEEIQKHFDGLPSKLSEQQKMDIDSIDPIVFKRFPNFKSDLAGTLNDHEPDMPNDLNDRKVYTYEDQVRYDIDAQMRRMAVTFRTNLAKRQKAEEAGEDPSSFDEKYPLFFQKNNKSNIISTLTGRSNVQVADNLNPIAALSQSHKVSLTGVGGYNKDKAPTLLRQVSESYRGKVDALDLSSGKNIGLTITLSNSDLDEHGHLVHNPNKKTLTPSAFIPFKYNNDLNRAAMATAHMKQAVPISGGEDPRVLGDPSDSAWKEISGAKIGLNLKVAYVPNKHVHEDAVALSESAASRMTTKQSQKYEILSARDMKGFSVGDKVAKGQYVGGIKMKYQGVIKNIENGSMEIESEWKMRVGDKIAGRHGNKGVVGAIIPDAEMPKIDIGNGKYEPAEILMSPLGVTGRMNLGQIYETNNGDLNKTTVTELANGRKIEATAGTQYIMRLNHIAEKKLQSYSDEVGSDKEAMGLRMGEMESLLLTSTEDQREILNYLRHQDGSDSRNKLDALLKSVGSTYKINR